MKILITGGSGTIGKSFIKHYHDGNGNEFFNVSRNEENIAKLQEEYPSVTSFICDIRNLELLINIFEKVKPDLVIHAAALKHINLAEENPSQAVDVNVLGSINVIKASIRAEVPITVGVSTDKACDPDSIYGYTKYMMECMFMEAHNQKTKFVCVRFANVANSSGSVIPFWLNSAMKFEPLKLTDPKMNRLMFSKKDSARLITQAIDFAYTFDKPVVVCQKMKSVNMLDLAEIISKNITIVGKRPGERLNETLISEKELPYTTVQDEYVYIFTEKEKPDSRYNLQEKLSSETAEHMSVDEIKKLIWTE